MKDIEIELKRNTEEDAQRLADAKGVKVEVYYKVGAEYVDEWQEGCRVIAVFRDVPRGMVGKVRELR